MKILEQIKPIRKEKRLNLTNLSKETGISRPTLTKIESGKGRIDVNQLDIIFSCLGYELIIVRK